MDQTNYSWNYELAISIEFIEFWLYSYVIVALRSEPRAGHRVIRA